MQGLYLVDCRRCRLATQRMSRWNRCYFQGWRGCILNLWRVYGCQGGFEALFLMTPSIQSQPIYYGLKCGRNHWWVSPFWFIVAMPICPHLQITTIFCYFYFVISIDISDTGITAHIRPCLVALTLIFPHRCPFPNAPSMRRDAYNPYPAQLNTKQTQQWGWWTSQHLQVPSCWVKSNKKILSPNLVLLYILVYRYIYIYIFFQKICTANSTTVLPLSQNIHTTQWLCDIYVEV